MDKDIQELDYRELELSVRKDHLEMIDQVLKEDLKRSWERLGINGPRVHQCLEGWTYKSADLRRTPLGKSLLIIAASAIGKGFVINEDVEQATEIIYRQLFGENSGIGYILPQRFHKTQLGQLIHDAAFNKHFFGEMMTPKEACILLGVTRQSLHERSEKGKLQRFYRGRRYLYVRSEIEEWKKQREQ